jgi:GTP cyclohydrolase IB
VTLEDVQAQPDSRGVPLDEVGVRGLRHPIVVWDREREKQETIAEVTMSVSLSAHVKGTHLSRFVEVLGEHAGEVTMRTIPSMLAALRRRLDARRARMEVCFPYFIERAAPITGARALMDYQCQFSGEADDKGNRFTLTVRVPVTSVCPCSKAISDYGAHNQRGYITIGVRACDDLDGEPQVVWIEELVELAEQSASAPVFPLLKRPDERHLTMLAYDNPVFVEDMVRSVAHGLRADPRVAWFAIEAVNDESIHNHSAFARVEEHRSASARIEGTRR